MLNAYTNSLLCNGCMKCSENFENKINSRIYWVITFKITACITLGQNEANIASQFFEFLENISSFDMNFDNEVEAFFVVNVI